jgi:hypothetical protein
MTCRRLGDQWHENEVHVDKDGKKTERETWHNVGDSEIEAFKHDWSEKHEPKAELVVLQQDQIHQRVFLKFEQNQQRFMSEWSANRMIE